LCCAPSLALTIAACHCRLSLSTLCLQVKGVTWCGTSPGSNLTMANVPWHHEVKAFCETLAARVDDAYGLAAEHAHSCCVLLAKKSTFQREGRWWTNIDYPKFFDLFARWEASGGAETFSSADYLLPTPDWAVYGSVEAGFDPEEVRKYRHAKDGSVSAAEYKSSESGCG
jgi:tRNA wybutosine-synthesizing protein 1